MRKPLYHVKVMFMTLLICFSLSDAASASDGIETAGNILQFVLPAAAAGLAVSNHDEEGLTQFAESGILSIAVTYGLKYTISETRPNGGQHSFPSGHSSLSFTSAEFIRERYGWNYGIPAYLAASFVGYSRVESHEHYTRDVIAGAVIGIGSSCLFTTPNKNINVRAEVGNSFYGIGMSHSW